MKRLIHAAVLAAALAFALLLCGCSGAETGHKAPQRAAVESGERQFAQPSDGDFIAIFSTSLGEVRAVLYPDAAPMAVQNFVGLARSGYYDNTVIWRAQFCCFPSFCLYLVYRVFPQTSSYSFHQICDIIFYILNKFAEP